MSDYTFRIDQTVKDYRKNNQIEREKFFDLRKAAALQDLVDLSRSKMIYAMTKDEYDSILKGLSEEEKNLNGVLEKFEDNFQIKIYDIQEAKIFEATYLKIYGYDKSEADV
ncbi:hypothetical protein [Vagococcus xieshaowenii]|uniref:Uncharacterized protein n=1 Tax=Vagococcus xieshaowenii TaxID=2562451 RepID=A0AAJ5EFX4_9ENTE|nr:hypothetical protein [Vagococcus xieshaowenii]QCA29163.1 hypothetical protein E4Z98_07485 [Vagococcus xieshaowenii]TFZ40859.1 hypothetical protein E4031_05605 [Vagococcus xieshaowenii]